jgi:hypothetical protein
MMLNSRFRRLALLAVVASVGAIGYSYAGGPRARQAGGAPAAEGGCPFAAIRAAFMGSHGAHKDVVNAEAELLAPEEALVAADGDCPDGSCPLGAARAAFFGPMAQREIAREVTKTADGVVIRISSKKPELVQMIQARFQPMIAATTPAGGSGPRGARTHSASAAGASGDEFARK